MLMAVLDAIYRRKMESAVYSVRDDLVNPTIIAIPCFLGDSLQFANILLCVLQGLSLIFLHVKYMMFPN